jgi:predicted nucleotidyltransferase
MISSSQIKFINSILLRYEPEKIALFGSRKRGEENKNSDLDILVSFKNGGKSPYSILELLDMEKKIGNKLGYPVEIVNERNIKNEHLKHNILNDLLIIYPQKNEL